MKPWESNSCYPNLTNWSIVLAMPSASPPLLYETPEHNAINNPPPKK